MKDLSSPALNFMHFQKKKQKKNIVSYENI